MAVDTIQELAPVQRLRSRFNRILQIAREAKPSTTVEPQVPISEILEDVKQLREDFGYGRSLHTLVEAVAQDVIYNVMVSWLKLMYYHDVYQYQKSASIDDPEFVRVWDLLDVVQTCEENGQCNPGLVVILLEDLFDTQTTIGCRKVFQYLESRRSRIVARDWDKKHFSILRSCNELLRRRLSRAEDAVFCGRVFFFLFQVFPLGDKSSVNLRGEFHTANTTTFEDLEVRDTVMQDVGDETVEEAQQDEKRETSGDKIASENIGENQGVTASEATKEGAQVSQPTSSVKHDDSKKSPKSEDKEVSNDELYPIFWRLQEYFSNPPRLFDGEHFITFKQSLQLTIAKFKSIPTELQQNTASVRANTRHKAENEDEDIDTNGTDGYRDVYNPKFLTGRELFDLELSDIAFQRHVLVQALIMIDFLLSLTEKGKKRLIDLKAQKALMFGFTLSEEDAKWALSTKNLIADYLRQHPEGNFYYRMVDTVLSRDKNWVRWKVESCPPIVRPSLQPSLYHEAQIGAEKASAVKRVRSAPLGAVDLSFLSNSEPGNGLERLKQPDRYQIPDIKSFVDGVMNDELDMDFAEGDEARKAIEEAKASKIWRTLRIASRTKLARFDKIDEGRKLQALLDTEATENGTGDENIPNGKMDNSIEDHPTENMQV
ncbi:MAG: hypothetical protein M1820_005600 [Bogoriella megaspora]|nr:MAG: hypothetical protein M1820_005600 [Bogoriella megaspora]